MSPCLNNMGRFAAAKRKVRGRAPQILKPIQNCVLALRHTASFRMAMKAKKIAQLRVSLDQPRSSRPG